MGRRGRRATLRRDLRYSGVVSSGKDWKHRAQLLGYRLLGFRDLKLKVDASTTASDIAKIHRIAGHRIHLRADVNMGWDVSQALHLMPALARNGIRSFEQPLTASDFGGAARVLAGMAGLAQDAKPILPTVFAAKVVVIVAAIVATQWLMRNRSLEDVVARTPWWITAVVTAAMLFAVTITQGSGQAFIYFQF